jgi:hypothetical protein
MGQKQLQRWHLMKRGAYGGDVARFFHFYSYQQRRDNLWSYRFLHYKKSIFTVIGRGAQADNAPQIVDAVKYFGV